MWIALALLLPSLPAQDTTDPYAALANQDRQTPITRVVQAVTPSVVTIETETARAVRGWPWLGRQAIGRGGGTGVVVHEDGYVVTNYHVVQDARRIEISFADDPIPYSAEVLSHKREADLALLRIKVPDGARDSRPADPAGRGGRGGRADARLTPQARLQHNRRVFQAVRMGTSVDLMPGETVIAIGNPHGQTHTVSTGIVSGLHRDVEVPAPHNLRFEGLIQTDASINPGNSGGPLLNVRGELIGINTVMNSTAENIGFAIPVDQVAEVLADELYPNAGTSWLGMDVTERSPLLVTRVWPDGPAAMAGVCEGDQLVSIDGTAVESPRDWVHSELQVVPGANVALRLAQNGEERSVELQAWDKLNGMLFQRTGATFEPYQVGGNAMAVVTYIAGAGPAADIGLEPGDLLPALRPKMERYRSPSLRILGKQDLARVVAQLEPGSLLELNVFRDLNQDGAYTTDEALEGELRIR